MSDRYLRIVLTVIAVELAWIGLKDVIPSRLDAQAAPPAPARVVIAGVDLPQRTQFLPVAIAGMTRNVVVPQWAGLYDLKVEVEPGDRPLRTEGTVNARIVEPIQIDTSRPLDVKSVTAEGAARPGL